VERATFRVVSVFGDGQRNLATARSMCIFYLWRRLAHLATARTICVATATAYLLSLATASAPDDGPRNLLTPGNSETDETSGARNFLS